MLWRSGGDVDVLMSTLPAMATGMAMATVMLTSDGKSLQEEHIKNGEEHLFLPKGRLAAHMGRFANGLMSVVLATMMLCDK